MDVTATGRLSEQAVSLLETFALIRYVEAMEEKCRKKYVRREKSGG